MKKIHLKWVEWGRGYEWYGFSTALGILALGFMGVGGAAKGSGSFIYMFLGTSSGQSSADRMDRLTGDRALREASP